MHNVLRAVFWSAVAKQTVPKHIALGQSLYLFTVSQAKNVEGEGLDNSALIGMVSTGVARTEGWVLEKVHYESQGWCPATVLWLLFLQAAFHPPRPGGGTEALAYVMMGLRLLYWMCMCVLCICVCVHLCSCGHSCAHVGGYTRKPEINVRCLLQTRSSVFFETGIFHKTWSSPIWLN